ncbi:MAG: hypothetical protein PVSMB4_13890 [Ktedonobacterales bacterium]
MSSSHLPGSQYAHDVEHTARSAANSPAMTLLSRFGYAAKGVVYLIIGGLAGAAAIGAAGGKTTDQHGVIQAIYQQPFGKFLLVLVAIGWLGYALWSWVEAGLDTEGKGTDAKGIVARVGYAVVGFSYAGLAIGALRLSAGMGSSGKSSDAQTQDWTARLLGYPLGVALVVLVGLVVLAIAGILYYRAYTAEFRQQLDIGTMPGRSGEWVVTLGRLGYAALGIVFTIIGIFLIAAAFQHNAGEAKGLAGALGALAQQPLGQLLLLVVALGLIAYGAFSLAEARCRRIGPA